MSMKAYKYDELSDEAKKRVIEKNWSINVGYQDWRGYVIEYAKTIGALMGIDIVQGFYSGFSSQGDGACVEGYYAYKKGSVKAVMEYAPKDRELHRIVRELYQVQRNSFYRLTAQVSPRGYGCHEYCTDIDVSMYDHRDNDLLTGEKEEAIKELLRDYMRWIYRQFERKYEHITSKEAIEETIRANEYEFDENGNII
jgi:hypothetical protein